MKKFDWSLIAKELLEAMGGKDNIKSFQHCASRFRFYAVDDKKVKKSKLASVQLAKGVNKDGDQWQVIFGAGTVNKVYDAFEKHVTGGKKTSVITKKTPLWSSSQSIKSNSFSLFRRGVRSFADIFIPLIPVFIAGGLSLALTSLIGQVAGDNPTRAALGAKSFFEMIGGGILGSLPAFVGYTAMRKFGGTPMIGLAIGIIMVAPSLLNGWISSSNYVIAGFGTSDAEFNILKEDYIKEHFSNIFKNWQTWQNVDPTNHTDGLVGYASANGMNIGKAFALFPNAPTFFSFSFIGYQAQVFPTVGIIAVAYWIERGLKKIAHESIAIIVIPLGTVIASLFLGFMFVGPLGRLVGYGITSAFQGIYKYTNWPGFGLGGALLGFAYPFLVVTGLHQGFVPVEASIIAETATAYGHSFTWITAVGSVSNVAQGMVGLTLAVMLWKKAPKASSIALTGSVSANLGITEPILFGINLPIRFGLLAAACAAAVGGYYVGMTHTVANSLGSASWLGLVQFDFTTNSEYHKYLSDYGFHTTPGLSDISPIINETIALVLTSISSVVFTLWFAKTFGKKSMQDFINLSNDNAKKTKMVNV